MFRSDFHSLFFHIPQMLWKKIYEKKLKAGIDIGCNIPDIVLHIAVSVF